MGLLDSLKKLGGGVAASLNAEITKFKNVDAVNASLAIVALTAGADGEIEPAETKAGADFVRKGDLFQSFDRAKLADTLAGYYAKATDPILKEDLFDVIRKVKGTDAARAAVKVGVGIANADGEFEPEEKEVLREVCQVLGLNPADFRGLAA